MGYVNDIIQTHIAQASCSHDATLLDYCIMGGGDHIYYCKHLNPCPYKKIDGMKIYCMYFEELVKKIKQYQEPTV